jgi:hypothetical protein
MIRHIVIVLAGTLGSIAFAAEEPATAEGDRTLERVVVEARAQPSDFADVQKWAREVRDGLARAKLKQRDELTDHDVAQIMVLEGEMDDLKRSLGEIERLVRKHKFRQTLTQGETVRLARNYQKVEAILENIPDAFMPRCRLMRKYAQRNKAAVCEVDYLAAARTVDEYRRKRGGMGESAQTSDAIAQIERAAGAGANTSAGRAKPVRASAATGDPVTAVPVQAPKPQGARPVHIVADDFRLEQVRVAFAGDAMVMREDFHAVASERDYVRPAHAMHIELPIGAGLSITPDDRLKIVGYLRIGGEVMRTVQLPRSATSGYAMALRGDGTIEGTFAAYEYGWSDRRRLAPVRGARVFVDPRDALFQPQYDVSSVDQSRPFVRYDVAFVGVDKGQLALALRRYDAPDAADPASAELFRFDARPGTIEIAGLSLELREIEEGRIKYVVKSAAPAAVALAAVGAP